MDSEKLHKVAEKAVLERGCQLVSLEYDDDDNVIVITVDRLDGDVQLGDCEYIHRAVLQEFDRNVEDYSLTVTSLGIDAAEADEMLKSINE